MENNTVTDNAKRAMAKAIMDDILQMIDSNESGTITPEEIVAHMKQFMADPPAEKVEKAASDDAASLEIKKRFWSFGNISCKNGELLLRDVSGSDKDGYLQLQQEYSSLRSLLQDKRYCEKIWRDHTDHTSLILTIEKMVRMSAIAVSKIYQKNNGKLLLSYCRNGHIKALDLS